MRHIGNLLWFYSCRVEAIPDGVCGKDMGSFVSDKPLFGCGGLHPHIRHQGCRRLKPLGNPVFPWSQRREMVLFERYRMVQPTESDDVPV